MRIAGPSLKMAKGGSPPCVVDDHNCTVLEIFFVKGFVGSESKLTRTVAVNCGTTGGELSMLGDGFDPEGCESGLPHLKAPLILRHR